jgi:hypothetical protein
VRTVFPRHTTAHGWRRIYRISGASSRDWGDGRLEGRHWTAIGAMCGQRAVTCKMTTHGEGQELGTPASLHADLFASSTAISSRSVEAQTQPTIQGGLRDVEPG